MRRPGVRSLLRVMLLLPALTLSTVAWAQFQPQFDSQEKPIDVSLVPLSPQPRTEGPLVMDAVLLNRTQTTQRGRLILRISNTELEGAAVILDDLVLAQAQQAFRLALPPAILEDYDKQMHLRASFVTADKTYDLSDQLVSVTFQQRSLVVVLADPWLSDSGVRRDLFDALRFDRLLPPDLRQRLTCLPTRQRPGDLPETALGYCGIDVLLLPGEGFVQCTPKQLEAVAAWVKAGGALLVQVDRQMAGLPGEHLDFLTHLLGEASRTTLPTQPGLELRAWELGAAALLIGDALPTGMENELAAHLWRLRHKQRQAVRDAGVISGALQQPSPQRLQDWQWRQMHDQDGDGKLLKMLTPQSVSAGGSLQALAPQSIRLLPINQVLGLLALTVLLIGPVDYFLLGLLKRRRWTWITVPTVIIVMTSVVILIANRTMGRENHARTVRFIDVGADGAVLRQSDLTLRFAGREQVLQQPQVNTLCTPIGREWLGDWHMGFQSDSSMVPARYVGRFPQRYVLERRLPQWSPQLERSLHIGNGNAEATLDQQVSQWLAALTPAQVADMLKQKSRQWAGPNDWAAFLLQGERSVGLNLTHATTHQADVPGRRENVTYQTLTLQQPQVQQLSQFILEACQREALGWMSVVGQVSPTGGPSLEDLAAVDSTDPTQCLLVLVRGQENLIEVVRRRFVLPSEEKQP